MSALIYQGAVEIGVGLPDVSLALTAGVSGIGLAYGNLTGEIAALASFTPVEIDFGAQLTLAGEITTAIDASLSLGITPPSLSAQIAIVAGIVTALEAQLTAINVQLSIITDLQNIMLTGGLYCYTYTGLISGLAGAVSACTQGMFANPGDTCTAVIMGGTASATISAMSGIFIGL